MKYIYEVNEMLCVYDERMRNREGVERETAKENRIKLWCALFVCVCVCLCGGDK